MATNKGFSIFSLDPYLERIKRPFSGGIKCIQMVGNCNLILLVPTGDDPMYTSDSVILWDDKRLKSSGTIKFTNSVEKISFTRDMYVVA